MTKLSDLSDDVVSAILDLVGGDSLFRVILLGSATLNKKIMRAIRRFEMVYDWWLHDLVWPKSLLSSLSALEHLSVTATDQNRNSSVLVHSVDLMALPSTLRTLKLEFEEAVFCLIDLPPPSYTGGPFTPRLRSEFKEKFVNLTTLQLRPPLHHTWNFNQFWKESLLWPLDVDPILYPYPLEHVSELPDSISALKVRIPDEQSAEHALEVCFPPALSQLALFKYNPHGGPFAAIATRELPPLSMLANLTTLTFRIQRMDQNLLSLLPHHSLRSKSSTLTCSETFPGSCAHS